MVLKENETREILEGRRSLDFPSLVLRPHQDADTNEYHGSGLVQINNDNTFELKFFLPQPMSVDEVFGRFNIAPGKLVGTEDYYEAEAIDIYDRRWVIGKFLLYPSTGPGGTIVIGHPTMLKYTTSSHRSSRNGNSLRIYYKEDIGLPLQEFVEVVERVGSEKRKSSYQRKLTRFSACGTDFDIEYDRNWTAVGATSKSLVFSDNNINHILDSISFVTANTCHHALIQVHTSENSETRLYSGPKENIKSRILPPIKIIKNDTPESIWKIFDKYLRYISDSDCDARHPISVLVGSVIEGGKSSLEAQALTLCVSIESLLSREYENVATVEKKVKDSVDVMLKFIASESAIDDNTRQRATSVIGAMKTARVKDTLLELQRRELLSEMVVSTYGKVRNKLAHGAGFDWDRIQEHLDQCSIVLVLFYHLIFLKIDYQGEYTDYTEHSHTLKAFCGKLA